MLYYLSSYLESCWGPFRLLRSHAFLLALGTFLSALLTVFVLPHLFNKMPKDHGKDFVADGKNSVNKPTGMGLGVTLLVLPIILLVLPWSAMSVKNILLMSGVLVCLYLSMWFGFLDDRSVKPWGRVKKGLIDIVIALVVAALLWWMGCGSIWQPFVKGVWLMPFWWYVPCMGFMLFVVTNATNCTDGVDGLAGSLTMISLSCLAALLYLVIGYVPVATYLLIPSSDLGAVWAILLMSIVGGFAGYLWWNAEKSQVLMGDAGSRFLGLLLGIGVLVTRNPWLLLAFAPVVLVNGGAGLVKILLLKFFGILGMDVRPLDKVLPQDQARKCLLVRAVQHFRFPIHDHCKKELHWSNAQVLMRFVLIQSFVMPLLLLLLVKIR